ncbi:MAG: hypothetical protein KAG37_02530 [Flavobacteriales bacterium]|nr:hypothetical protein [Flavobacteriales bacterium]
MKKLFIVAILSIFALNISAQETPVLDSIMEASYRAEKKALITEALQLTEEEGKEFWPLYNEYNEKMEAKNKELIDLVNDNAEKLDKLSNDEAEEIWKEKIDTDYALIKLEKKYFKKMLRVLHAGKVVRYFQAENKIKSLMNAQMAVEVPLVNTPE